MAWTLSAFLLSLFVAFSAGQSRCPPVEDMAPCTCQSDCPDCPARMVCNDIFSVHDLTEVFQKTRSYPFKDLVIDHSAFPYLPSQGIEQKGFRHIYLKNSFMNSLFESAPTSKFLNEIHINSTSFQRGLDWGKLQNLTELRRIVLVNVQVRKLNRKFGDNMPSSLRHVWFEGTKTSSIESGAFEKLDNLETLYINSTNVRVLDRSIFSRPSNIKAFMILNSKIQSVPEDMFSDMPELKYIVLSGNLITRFQRSVFERALPQLSMLTLYNNSIRCDCATRWVTEVRKFPHFFSARCSEPTELEDLRIDLLRRKDFHLC